MRIIGSGNKSDGKEEDGSPEPLSLEEVSRAYRAPLKRFFAKRVRAGQDPDDLVQEVFARLAARAGEGAEEMHNPQAFLFQIASNLLRDQARREQTRRSATDALRHADEGIFEEITPERVLQGREGVQALQRALNELPERTRSIFVLHRFEEFRYAEIAQRLGISTSLVEKHMMDAIRHLNFRLRQP